MCENWKGLTLFVYDFLPYTTIFLYKSPNFCELKIFGFGSRHQVFREGVFSLLGRHKTKKSRFWAFFMFRFEPDTNTGNIFKN